MVANVIIAVGVLCVTSMLIYIVSTDREQERKRRNERLMANLLNRKEQTHDG